MTIVLVCVGIGLLLSLAFIIDNRPTPGIAAQATFGTLLRMALFGGLVALALFLLR